MDELLSFKGLVTVTISSLLTIKALRLNLRISRDIRVNGNGNTVIVNETLRTAQKTVGLLWPVLAALIVLTYPLFGEDYNFVLKTFAVVALPSVAISSGVAVYKARATLLPNLLYILGTAAMCRLAFVAQPYLVATARTAHDIYPALEYLAGPDFRLVLSMTFLHQILVPLVAAVTTVCGFAGLFLSLLYFSFVHLAARSPADPLRFFLHYVAMGCVGFLFACNLVLAASYHDIGYIGRLVRAVLP